MTSKFKTSLEAFKSLKKYLIEEHYQTLESLGVKEKENPNEITFEGFKLSKIEQSLERLEELENDRLLDRAEKEELERKNAVLNHNLEEKVEIICELENKIQDLELLEALKQRWQQEEWCQGIELSAESLNSLFKYNKDLFDRNLELDKKLESEFEDSADAICKALAERDKLLDENIELQQENQDLKEKNEMLKAKAKKYDEIVNLRTTPNALESCLAEYMTKCIAFEKENQELKKIIQKLLNGLNNIVECKPKEIRGFILLLIEDFEDRFKEVLGNE